MPSTVPKKDSSHFLSDYYFDTESPVAFTSPLALYREAKKHYPSLSFRQVKTWLHNIMVMLLFRFFVLLQ